MRTVTALDLARARVQGRERGLAGAPMSEDPHGAGRVEKILGIAWRRGWREGHEQRLADNRRQHNLPDDA